MPLPFHPNESAFNRLNAVYLAHASEIAYLRSPATEARERLGLRSIAFFNPMTRTRGFLGVCDTHAVISFRGTNPTTLPNWVTDLVVKLVEHGEYEGRVHRGFASALKRIWAKFEAFLHEIEDRPLFLTGHSMGGALAVLAACRLAKVGIAPTAIYTFGAPRVGDRTFCAGYSLPTYRIVNGLDLVPEIPFASVKRLLPAKARITNEKFLGNLKRMAGKVPCYGHVKTFVYIDRDGVITTDADVQPWHTQAVLRAIATKGKDFVQGVTDHLISNYIRGLEREADVLHRVAQRQLKRQS